MKPNTETDAAFQLQNITPPKVIGKPFPPGVSGNPSGRRRGSVSLAAMLKETLTKADAKAICKKLISQAKAGNHHAQRLILDKCGDELPFQLSVGFAAPPLQVHLFLPAGRAEGIMPCEPAPTQFPDGGKPALVAPPKG